ncbi:hypothetical protein [Neoroseomonas soli]|uniref:Uncharacterized protein n=1 Tax=Neoroseomonas soli TaxID=1081025 RepID=A0A9X9X4B2_9PROT|nr:hypothetical protein [Neoroseomonas soli]MBR0674241.1 hypothetical protein [Neoroseomonas soli]
MSRIDDMLDRLPPPLRADQAGLLGRMLANAAVQFACVDEEMDRIRRSHLLALAFDMVDLAKLGALFDLRPAPWEPLELFRVRLRATIAARLAGAVTRNAMEPVLVALLDGAQRAMGSRYAGLAPGGRGHVFRDPAAARRPGAPVFREYPPRRRRDPALVAQGGRLRPLDCATLTHRGLGETPLQAILRGRVGGRTAVPLLAHLGTGRVILFRGLVPAGVELRLDATAERLTATLDGREASDRLITAAGFTPGARLPLTPDATPQPIMLRPGANEIWFLPLALYGERILDRGALALPGLELRHGVFGSPDAPGTNFDDSLFEQQPSVSLDLFWQEAMPAAFRFEVPGGTVRHTVAEPADRAAQRDALLSVLGDTVALLRAAGVDGRVVFVPLQETQRQRDRGRAVNPYLPPDSQPSETRLAGVTALFDETATEGARFA